MAKPVLKPFPPSGSRIILVSSDLYADTNFKGTHSAGALNTREWKKWRLSTKIAVYLGNGTR